MDRFMMRISIGYPGREQEIKMASQFLSGQTPDQAQPICSTAEVLAMKETVSNILVKGSVLGYIEDIVDLTRHEERFVLGASPRAVLALVRSAQAKAFLEERDFVKPDDVKAIAMKVLLHRLSLTSESRIRKEDPANILNSLIVKAKIPV